MPDVFIRGEGFGKEGSCDNGIRFGIGVNFAFQEGGEAAPELEVFEGFVRKNKRLATAQRERGGVRVWRQVALGRAQERHDFGLDD